jgi:ubiquinone/menaquinone biosynthesis C-methylase UbiE
VRYLADRSSFANAAGVLGNQAAALIAMDLDALAAMGVHPLVSFLANMHLEQEKKKEHSPSAGSEFKQHELAGWDAKAGAYGDYLAKVTGQVVDRLLHAAKVTQGTKLLDIATGPGHVAGAARALGASPLGIDFAPSMVAMARRNYPNVEFREGDAEALDFADASFDAVICAFGIGHLSDPDKGVREVFRVLEPGGRYTFSWWCAPDKHEFFALVQGAVKAHGDPNVSLPPAPSNFRFSDPEECKRVLAAAGFKEVEVHECVPVYTPNSPEEVLDLIYRSTVRTALVLERQTAEARQRINRAIVEGALRHKRGPGFQITWPANIASGRKP